MFSNVLEELASTLDFSPPFPPRIGNSPATSADILKYLGRLPPFPSKPITVTRSPPVQLPDGLELHRIRYNVGYGPDTEAVLLRPADVEGPLPSALFLHSHDDVKSFGKEKVVDGAGELPPDVAWVRSAHYGSRAPANELAKKGYCVMVHDCFLWGSRAVAPMPPRLVEVLGRDNDREALNVMLESMAVAKYLSLYGTTLAGLLNFDDRVALAVLRSLTSEVDTSQGTAVVGLSGGGCRALLMHATCPHDLSCVVSVGAMATYRSMVNRHVAPHSWMFFPHDLARISDWPGVACVNPSTPLFVQYCAADQLFTQEGMEEAHRLIESFHRATSPEGRAEEQTYRGSFYPVPHSFTVAMQDDAFQWALAHLSNEEKMLTCEK